MKILFKPLGNLIPGLSWATVRTRINITDPFKETNQLCKSAQIMENEYQRLGRIYANGKRKIKIPPIKMSDPNTYLIELLSHDIQQMCIENTITIKEITDVFNIKKIIKPEHIPAFAEAWKMEYS